MNLHEALTLSEKIRTQLLEWGFSYRIASYTGEFFGLFLVFVISIIVYQIVKFGINRFLKRLVVRSKSRWDDYLYENKVFTRLALIIPALIINSFLPATISQYPKLIHLLQVVLQIYSAAVMILVANSFLNSVYHIYGDYEVASSKPIKGYVQIGKIIVFVVGGIVVISMMIGQSPLSLLAGLGAMSAVLLLIFKDSLLGFVAGVQISNNNMMQIGDWVSLPKYGADGIVIDISLVIVKIRNFDNSVVTLPTYTFISDAVFNWRGMMESGGRRLKRSILLDMTTIRPMDEQLKTSVANMKFPVYALTGDQTMITNLSLFRAYLTEYLGNHPAVNQQNLVMVRMLQPTENGLPVEIMAFSMLENIVDFENFQSELFEHIFAVLPAFGMKVLQRPMLLLPLEKNS
ncbi:MAG: mechanosensitive ion channel family protein [Syntrophothermus sp.]